MTKVLIADNDPEYLRSTKDLFEENGYAVEVATNPEEAEGRLISGEVDLAILDIRLRDDTDPKDVSGLKIAGKEKSIPIIIVTRLPDYKNARQALMPGQDGLPRAVGFVAREEGPDALLQAVGLALLRLNPVLKNNILKSFEVPATVALRERIKLIGPEEASRRLAQGYEETAAEMTKYREQESQRAAELHKAGLAASATGVLLIVVATILLLVGAITSGVLTLVLSVVTQGIRALFSVKEDAAHKRVGECFGKLEEINRIGSLLTMCESLESPAERDECRKKVINHILKEKWLIRKNKGR